MKNNAHNPLVVDLIVRRLASTMRIESIIKLNKLREIVVN